MENTFSSAQDNQKIQKASVMVADEILFKNIAQLIEYRKKVAIDFLECKDENTRKEIRSVYENSEIQLRQILGI